MHPLFVLIPGALIGWFLLQKNKRQQVAPALPPGHPALAALQASGAAPSPSSNTANYMQHVTNAQYNLDTLQNPSASPGGLANVQDATAAMTDPIDTLTAQKDLNLLGADPALAEDGIMGPKTIDGIKSFQSHVGLPATGSIDPSTALYLRSAVATVVNNA